MGTLKDVQFKYLFKAVADTVFEYECQGGNPGGEGNRNVFLNDSLFSTTTPIILDIGYFNDCLGVTGVEDVVAAITGELLEASRPNPLRTSALISYSLPAEAPVKLDVYDVRGRHVRTLVDEIRPAGRHTVAWNGRLENGAPLPNGVYFYRLHAADAVETRKILLMR
jgi:hypothetical protein